MNRRARALTRHRRALTRVAVLVGACVVALLVGILAWAYISATAGAETNIFSAAAVDHITITPATSSIVSGGSQAYGDTALDASNNSFGTVTSTSTFSITPDGSCTGSTCTASVPGNHTVTAHFWGLSAGATLTVLSNDGSGTLGSNVASVGNGSTGNTVVLTYTAATGGLSGGEVDVAVPSGWTAPTASNAIGCTTASGGTLGFSGQTIKVSGLTLATGGTLTITYGATSGGACTSGDGATASTTAGPATWQGQEKSTAGGTLTNLAASPSITVDAADGSGTLSTTTTNVSASSHNNTMTFTYTAASAGGMSGGEVDVAVPSGWTAPTASNAIGCTTASTGTLSFSGQTIKVSGVTLSPSATLTVTYGAQSGGACASGDGATATSSTGAQTWQGKEKSTGGGTLTNLAASPSITVYAADGSGTLTTATASVANGSTGNTITFTYTAAAGGVSSGEVDIAVPGGWTAPSTANAAGCTTASAGTLSISGSTIRVSALTLAASGTLTVTYGATSGTPCTAADGATAPTTAGAATWQGQEMSTAGGTLASITPSPSITVLAANGSGTLSTTTTSVAAGSTGNTIAFTYTAATGGMSNGAVTIAVPSGWTAPVTTNAIGCVSASAGTVSTTAQTITVSGLTLSGGATATITYGDTSGGSCTAGDGATAPSTTGAQTWQGQQRSTATGTLTNLAASPSISVTGSPNFLLTPAAGPYVAGLSFSVTVQARIGTANDNSYTGSKSLTISAPTDPNGTQSGTVTSSATFSSTGSATVTVTLYDAASNNTFTISDTSPATRSGSSTIAINSAGTLSLTCPSTPVAKNGSGTVTLSVPNPDQYGNHPIFSGGLTVNFSYTNSGHWSGSAANATLTTGSSSVNFTVTNNGGQGGTTVTATTPNGYLPTPTFSCNVSESG